MKNKHSVTIAITGLSLLAASQAMAQITYNNLDLLLDFRNITTPTGSDITIDLGSPSAFVAAVTALPGGFAVLDSGPGFATSSYQVQFAFSDLTSLLGAPASDNQIGFSAAAGDKINRTALLYLTRKQTSPGSAPSTISAQQPIAAQGATATAIYDIGLELGQGDAQLLPSSTGNNAVSYPSGDVDSYQSRAEDSTSIPGIIDYGTSQSTAASKGGMLELAQTGAATIYEALWEVPVSGTGSDTYLGYFTFKANGELDFSIPSTTPTVPNVSISQSGGNAVISWPNTATFTLVKSSAVAGPWTPNTLSTNTSNGINSVTIPSPTGTSFFKLRYP